MSVKIYRVGGSVRDQIIGRDSKDVDFSVEASSYEEMRNYILGNGGTIYLETPEFVTLRGKLGGVNADFVLCRKESDYKDGRRPSLVEVGTIFDDLSRRDLTINSIAIDESGKYIDPFEGIKDIKNKVIRCVGCPEARLEEDGLRILRAIRFAITLGFQIHNTLDEALLSSDIYKWLEGVSEDRIREELHKCFTANTVISIHYLSKYQLLNYLFVGQKLWLKPTLEAR